MPSAAPPQAEVAGPPRTELEELQIKANQVTDDVSRQILSNLFWIEFQRKKNKFSFGIYINKILFFPNFLFMFAVVG